MSQNLFQLKLSTKEGEHIDYKIFYKYLSFPLFQLENTMPTCYCCNFASYL